MTSEVSPALSSVLWDDDTGGTGAWFKTDIGCPFWICYHRLLFVMLLTKGVCRDFFAIQVNSSDNHNASGGGGELKVRL